MPDDAATVVASLTDALTRRTYGGEEKWGYRCPFADCNGSWPRIESRQDALARWKNHLEAVHA